MSEHDSIKLHMLGLPVIKSVDEISMLTHISKYTIYQLSRHSDKYYKTYVIKKKSGKPRIISQPSRKLKGLQSWILINILNKIKVSNSCKGFEKKTTTLDNAKPHKGASTVLLMDLENFFPTIKSKQVYNVFYKIGYNKLISTILANICTYNGELPQGGPCSPKLANLVAWELDLRIQGYVGKRGITYTRYADDLTFSGLSPYKVVKIIPMVKQIIKEENFKINNSKTRIAGKSRAKIVTGLVISDDTVGIGKKKYKILRAKMHRLTLNTEQNNYKLLGEVKGWLSYLNSIDSNRFEKVKHYINKLNMKYSGTLLAQLIKVK